MNSPVVAEREVLEQPQAHAVVAVTSAGGLLTAITQAATNPQMDMDKVERMFKMHQVMVAQDAEAAFNDAMARTQTKIAPIVTDADNDHTHSRYATLAAINKAIVPIYSAEGLSVSFNTETKNDADPIPEGWMRTIALVSHKQGHTRSYHLDLPPDGVGAKGNTNKTGVQAAGSTNEYARRYLTRMIFNISTFDDNDGNDDTPRKRGAGEKRETEPKGYSDEAFAKYFPKWEGYILSGKLTAAEVIATASSNGVLTDEQKKKIEAVKKPSSGPIGVTYAKLEERLRNAKDADVLDADADLIREISDETQRKELTALYNRRKAELRP